MRQPTMRRSAVIIGLGIWLGLASMVFVADSYPKAHDDFGPIRSDPVQNGPPSIPFEATTAAQRSLKEHGWSIWYELPFTLGNSLLSNDQRAQLPTREEWEAANTSVRAIWMSPKSLEEIHALAEFSGLQWLMLDGVTDEHLAALPALDKLEALTIYDGRLTGEGLVGLRDRRKLAVVDLWHCEKFEAANISQLRFVESLRTLRIGGRTPVTAETRRETAGLDGVEVVMPGE